MTQRLFEKRHILRRIKEDVWYTSYWAMFTPCLCFWDMLLNWEFCMNLECLFNFIYLGIKQILDDCWPWRRYVIY